MLELITIKINKIILLIQWLESHSSKVHVLVRIRKRIKTKTKTITGFVSYFLRGQEDYYTMYSLTLL